MDKLLSLNFWFDLTPVRMSPAIEIGFFVAFSLLVISGLVIRILRKNRQDKFEREVMKRIVTLNLSVGLLGLAWLFLSFEEIQIFGSRFWFLLLALILIIVTIRIVMYHRREVPRLRLLEQSKAEANKYLPRRR